MTTAERVAARYLAGAKEKYVLLDDKDKQTGNFGSLEEAVMAGGKVLAKKKGYIRIMYTSPTPQFWSLSLERTH